MTIIDYENAVQTKLFNESENNYYNLDKDNCWISREEKIPVSSML
jgi:hypothetical protein